jgi:lysophospholipid acyltransferase
VFPEGTKPTVWATVITFGASAFWHGFYPGYYIFFFTAAVYTEVARGIDLILFIPPN